jgi:hypothetical protein
MAITVARADFVVAVREGCAFPRKRGKAADTGTTTVGDGVVADRVGLDRKWSPLLYREHHD